jgi:hypothetical protein
MDCAIYMLLLKHGICQLIDKHLIRFQELSFFVRTSHFIRPVTLCNLAVLTETIDLDPGDNSRYHNTGRSHTDHWHVVGYSDAVNNFRKPVKLSRNVLEATQKVVAIPRQQLTRIPQMTGPTRPGKKHQK